MCVYTRLCSSLRFAAKSCPQGELPSELTALLGYDVGRLCFDDAMV